MSGYFGLHFWGPAAGFSTLTEDCGETVMTQLDGITSKESSWKCLLMVVYICMCVCICTYVCMCIYAPFEYTCRAPLPCKSRDIPEG